MVLYGTELFPYINTAANVVYGAGFDSLQPPQRWAQREVGMRRKTPIGTASPDLKAELLDQLRNVVPEAFSETKLDFEKLQKLVGVKTETVTERFNFGWAGKRDALAMLQIPTRATLTADLKGSVNFDDAQHIFIEGENLEVLKVLYRSYFGRVKMIYIDPPYNTGSDLIYPDNFVDPLDQYLRMTGQKNGNGDFNTSEVDRSGRLHSAWLGMMYPRLAMARQLLSKEGVIFISIDEKEIANLIQLMNQVFGEENFLAILSRRTKSGGGAAAHHFAVDNDFIIVYAKNKSILPPLFIPHDPEYLKRYSEKDKDGRYFWDTFERSYTATTPYVIKAPDGKKLRGNWFRSEDRFKTDLEKGEIRFLKKNKKTWSVQFKQRLSDGRKIRSLLFEKEFRSTQDDLEALDMEDWFDFPKPVYLMKHIIRGGAEKDGLVMDFFAGSGTLADAAIQLNRDEGYKLKTINVQFPEVLPEESVARENGCRTIADIARERIKRALKKREGVRFFKLSTSNIRLWSGIAEKDADAYAKQIEAFSDSLVKGWKPENVIWEVTLREGYSLSSRMEMLKQVGKQAFWRVSDTERDQSFTICLDEHLNLDAVAKLGLRKSDILVCRDTALDDTLAANLALQCRLKVI